MKNDILNREDLSEARELFAAACEQSRNHDERAKWALGEFGDHGPDVSGCVRAHFPEVVKGDLRAYARNVSIYSDAAYAKRPKGVRVSTMRKLASAVAKRDGSGFYGPQA